MPEIIREICPSCGSGELVINKNYFCDWEGLSERMYLVICQKCKLGFFNKILTKKQIENLYNDDNYFQSEWCWYGRPYQEVWRERKREFEGKQLGWINKLKEHCKVLDIGCGGGNC